MLLLCNIYCLCRTRQISLKWCSLPVVWLCGSDLNMHLVSTAFTELFELFSPPYSSQSLNSTRLFYTGNLLFQYTTLSLRHSLISPNLSPIFETPFILSQYTMSLWDSYIWFIPIKPLTRCVGGHVPIFSACGYTYRLYFVHIAFMYYFIGTFIQ